MDSEVTKQVAKSRKPTIPPVLSGYGLDMLQRRDLLWLFGLSLVANGTLWVLMNTWYAFDSVIPLIGLAVILLNAGLSLLFIRKDTVITQAFGVTALAVQVLLLVLIVRTGLLGR